MPLLIITFLLLAYVGCLSMYDRVERKRTRKRVDSALGRLERVLEMDK